MGSGDFMWGATNYPEGLALIGMVNPLFADWVKQPDELGHYVSTAPGDSVATAWFQVPYTDDYRHSVDLAVALVSSFGDPAATGHVGFAVYLDGTSAASPGTKIAEFSGSVPTSPSGSYIHLGSTIIDVPGTHTLSYVVEWYDYPYFGGDDPTVGVRVDSTPLLADFRRDDGVWSGPDITLTFTVSNGVGPFEVVIDWHDGDIQTVDFPRDPSGTTVYPVVHTYAAYDYTNFPTGPPYTVTFPDFGVDEYDSHTTFISPLDLPVPALTFMTDYLLAANKPVAEMDWQDSTWFTPIDETPSLLLTYVTIIDWDDGKIDTLSQADIYPRGSNSRTHTYVRRGTHTPTIKLLVSNGWFQKFVGPPLVTGGIPLRQSPRDDALGAAPRQGHVNPSTSVQASARQGWRNAYR